MARFIIKVGQKRKWEISFALLGLIVIYLFFTITDLANSVQTGNKDSDRTIVHLALICLTGYLMLYVLLNVRVVRKSMSLGMLSLLAIWIFISSEINHAELWTILVQMNMSVLWILSYLFFYHYTQNESQNRNRIKWFCKVLLVLYLCSTVYYAGTAMRQYGRFFVLNVVYYSLAIFPWTLVMANTNESKIGWGIVALTVIISLKRGAIIALPVMYICEVLTNRMNKGNTGRKVIKLFALGILLCILFLGVDQLTDGFMSKRFSREELATGSGRTTFYKLTLSAIAQRNIIELFVGGGAGSSVKLLGTGVHNEWLEMLFSYGIVGLALYTLLIVSFITTTKRVFRTAPEHGPICLMELALYLILSLVSTGYGGYTGIFLFGFWGYIESLEHDKMRGLDG